MADEQTLDEQNLNAEAAGDELSTRVQVLEEQLAAAQDQSCAPPQTFRTCAVAPSRMSRRRTSSPLRNSLVTCCR